MTFLSFAAIIVAGGVGLWVLCQRQELDRHSPRGGTDASGVEAGAGRAPYDWAVDDFPPPNRLLALIAFAVEHSGGWKAW